MNRKLRKLSNRKSVTFYDDDMNRYKKIAKETGITLTFYKQVKLVFSNWMQNQEKNIKKYKKNG